MVFSSEGRRVVVRAADLVDMDHTPALRGEPAAVIAFRRAGRPLLALQKVAAARGRLVRFPQGHGHLADRDPRTGFSRLKRELEADNLDARTLHAGDHPSLPADAQAVVIAAPRRRLAAPLVETAARLPGPRRAPAGHVAARAATPAWRRCSRSGASAWLCVAVDPGTYPSGYDLFVLRRPHPVTRALAGSTCVFTCCSRVVEPLPPPGGDRRTARAPSPCARARPELGGAGSGPAPHAPRLANRDTPGPVSLAVAAECSGARMLDVSVQTTRLVVMGDADFAGNGPASGANFDLVLAALNWLVDREDQMAIAPKAVQDMRLVMDAAQLQWLFWGCGRRLAGRGGRGGPAGVVAEAQLTTGTPHHRSSCSSSCWAWVNIRLVERRARRWTMSGRPRARAVRFDPATVRRVTVPSG